MKDLVNGYKNFYAKYFESGDALYKDLHTRGQFPKSLVIACSDSRVDPAIVLNSDPGDIFVIRNVANIVPPYQPGDESVHGVSAALEFGVKVLEIPNIIVLGHSKCAGVNALLNPDTVEQTDFIGSWVDVAKPARENVHSGSSNFASDKNQCCEKEVVVLSLSNLLGFPWIKDRVERGEMKLHGWYFDIGSGALEQYDPRENCFIDLR